jgi:RNA polymerase sigma factor for flagellar operon FliA
MTSQQLDLEALWAAYKRAPERQLRDQLILHYAPVVKYVAGRVASGLPPSVDAADLVSYGIFGLIDAVERYEPGRGVKFETYAIARIRGAIMDELRSIDWVPRSVRAKARALERAFQTLEARLHRSPSDAELAAELSWSEEQLQSSLQQISMVGVAALDETLSGRDRDDGATLADTVADTGAGPVALFEVAETRAALARSIEALPNREKIVLTLYYYEGMTLADIGDVLGVTESRACQIHTKAVLHLRARLAATDRP